MAEVVLPDACEYCDRADVVLYAWHADVWCRDCMVQEPRPPGLVTGWPDHVPIGRPDDATYEQPFVWQTPDGAVLRGVPLTS